MPRFAWRSKFEDHELSLLHAEAFALRLVHHSWWERVNRYSLGWVCARDEADALIGFVNVVWDGAGHAFLLDTIVSPACRQRGIGTELVNRAIEHSRKAGCEWLHVDFGPELRDFYLRKCRFGSTDAGLIPL